MDSKTDADRAPVDAVVMRLVIELTVDDAFAVCKESEDESERDWFNDELLGDPELFLHSNLVGETIGTVKIVRIESA